MKIFAFVILSFVLCEISAAQEHRIAGRTYARLQVNDLPRLIDSLKQSEEFNSNESLRNIVGLVFPFTPEETSQELFSGSAVFSYSEASPGKMVTVFSFQTALSLKECVNIVCSLKKNKLQLKHDPRFATPQPGLLDRVAGDDGLKSGDIVTEKIGNTEVVRLNKKLVAFKLDTECFFVAGESSFEFAKQLLTEDLSERVNGTERRYKTTEKLAEGSCFADGAWDIEFYIDFVNVFHSVPREQIPFKMALDELIAVSLRAKLPISESDFRFGFSILVTETKDRIGKLISSFKEIEDFTLMENHIAQSNMVWRVGFDPSRLLDAVNDVLIHFFSRDEIESQIRNFCDLPSDELEGCLGDELSIFFGPPLRSGVSRLRVANEESAIRLISSLNQPNGEKAYFQDRIYRDVQLYTAKKIFPETPDGELPTSNSSVIFFQDGFLYWTFGYSSAELVINSFYDPSNTGLRLEEPIRNLRKSLLSDEAIGAVLFDGQVAKQFVSFLLGNSRRPVAKQLSNFGGAPRHWLAVIDDWVERMSKSKEPIFGIALFARRRNGIIFVLGVSPSAQQEGD